MGDLVNAAHATIVGPGEPVVGDDGTTFVQDRYGEIYAYDLATCVACFPKFYAFGFDPSVVGNALIVRGGQAYDAHGE
ncbi:MAG: hypothetical protein QOI55_1664, partial [Actinomycetota bacterium]|nr:hypothetical protein [Actinomycetota bacterium]